MKQKVTKLYLLFISIIICYLLFFYSHFLIWGYYNPLLYTPFIGLSIYLGQYSIFCINSSILFIIILCMLFLYKFKENQFTNININKIITLISTIIIISCFIFLLIEIWLHNSWSIIETINCL